VTDGRTDGHLCSGYTSACIARYANALVKTVEFGWLCTVTLLYTVSQKNMPPYFCPYLHQILTHFKKSFTGTLCGKFAIKWLLIIPPHLSSVATLPCETWTSVKLAIAAELVRAHSVRVHSDFSDTSDSSDKDRSRWSVQQWIVTCLSGYLTYWTMCLWLIFLA